jgi:two-component system chemotaxis response regulator CheY
MVMAKILIVDDSRTSRKILKNIFENNGYEVVGEAVDGKDGVEKFIKLDPDIVTLDITMPVLDGVSALKEIMNINKNSKVIMVTAAGQQNNVLEAIKYGASEFVTKPFEEDVILDVVSRLTED